MRLLAALLVAGLPSCATEDEPRVAAESPATASPAPEEETPEPSPQPSPEPSPGRRLVPVTKVVDGDTIWVRRAGADEKIRLIGIDTPEVDWYGGQAECFGEEAGRFAQRLLSGARVALELDRERLDRYGRTLAYVYLEDGRMMNLVLVRQGFAIVTIYPPNDRHEDRLHAAEARARDEARGLWSAC